MAHLILRAESNASYETTLALLNTKKFYYKLSEIRDFCLKNKIVDETYVQQIDDDNEDNDIRISMQEINTVYEEGECPEDLDFF